MRYRPGQARLVDLKPWDVLPHTDGATQCDYANASDC